MKIYDLVIIGSGPAGMSAAIYAQRAMLDFVMIEKEYMPGGQVVQTYEVDNYPGIPKTNGMDLGLKFSEHAKELGAKSITAEVKEIHADEEIKEIVLKNGDTLKTRTIILATGAVHQTLGIEGEEKLKGMGVSYCATCDGAFFRNKVTAVVGGGNVALEDAIFLSRMCEKVYLIHRRDEFRGAKILQDEVKKNDKIEILWNTIVTKIDGDEVVERLHIQDVDNHVDTSKPGIYDVTYIATDKSGNKSHALQHVVVSRSISSASGCDKALSKFSISASILSGCFGFSFIFT